MVSWDFSSKADDAHRCCRSSLPKIRLQFSDEEGSVYWPSHVLESNTCKRECFRLAEKIIKGEFELANITVESYCFEYAIKRKYIGIAKNELSLETKDEFHNG